MRAPRIPEALLDELIENEGELKTGPINAIGVLRLARDLKATRLESDSKPAAFRSRHRKKPATPLDVTQI
jgi:hypothetical protein